MPDASTLAAAKDVGGWVFATVAITAILLIVIRWLMGLLEKQTTALETNTQATEKLAAVVETLIGEVRSQRRR